MERVVPFRPADAAHRFAEQEIVVELGQTIGG